MWAGGVVELHSPMSTSITEEPASNPIYSRHHSSGSPLHWTPVCSFYSVRALCVWKPQMGKTHTRNFPQGFLKKDLCTMLIQVFGCTDREHFMFRFSYKCIQWKYSHCKLHIQVCHCTVLYNSLQIPIPLAKISNACLVLPTFGDLFRN